ncbi:MAG: MBL fold metallo-hydrolase [Gemmatimonadota bacterium]
MRVAALGSGSRGNAVLVESGESRILIDAGFSGSDLARRLAELEIEPEGVAGVVVTHEHRDHARGIGVAARRWGWSLYLNPATERACRDLLRGEERVRHFEAGRPFTADALEVYPFRNCHDAADPVAVTITEPVSGLRVGVATDLGRATGPVRSALAGCHILVLEANHDELRLRDGPYPWSIKQRIGGSRGHLSNRLAGELAADLVHPGLGGILLAHLSFECNDPALARATVEQRLDGSGFRGGLFVAGQATPSPFYEVGDLVRRARHGAQLALSL